MNKYSILDPDVPFDVRVDVAGLDRTESQALFEVETPLGPAPSLGDVFVGEPHGGSGNLARQLSEFVTE